MGAPMTMEDQLEPVRLHDGEWVIANPSRPLTEDEAQHVILRYLLAMQILRDLGVDTDDLARNLMPRSD
jgi:hypothetical protein